MVVQHWQTPKQHIFCDEDKAGARVDLIIHTCDIILAIQRYHKNILMMGK